MFPRGPQRYFLVLTFIVIVAIVLLADSFSDAILAVTLLSQFLIITTLLTSIHDRHVDASDSDGGYGDGAATAGAGWLPPMGAGGPAFTAEPRDGGEPFATTPARGGGWASVDDIDDGLLPGVSASYAPVRSGADGPAFTAEAAATNPFQLNRVRGAAEPAPCDYSVEAADVMDSDRKTVEHVRWRHDPHRVAAGVMDRKRLMDKYVREELDEEEDSQWWGRWDH